MLDRIMYVNRAALEAGLDDVLRAPTDRGRLEMIVCRPGVDERQVMPRGTLDLVDGLVGDNWRARGSRSTRDGTADPERQVTVMNARAIALVAGTPERWPLAGDQLYVDLDISVTNLPAGARLRIGQAVVEVSAAPHRGCAKFSERFGEEAVRFFNSPEGSALRLRGLNARIVVAGQIRFGDVVRVERPESAVA
jgi:MOSC domain-containing protein YiiM